MPDNTVDTLIDARWIIPVEPARETLSRHSIAIADGVIRDILPTAEAHAKYSAKQHFRLDDHVLIPGLINLHTHAAMSLLRGLADDLPLMDWLNNHIWPAEAKFVSPEFVRDGTLLACAEMLRGGITCFNDMYFFPEAAAQAALSAGMRAAIGMIVVDFPTAYAADADDYLSKGLAVRDEFRGEPLLSFTLAPHAPYTVSDKTFAKVLTYAEQLDLPIHIHLHETHDEIEASLKQYQMRPLERLHRLGLLGPNLIAVPCGAAQHRGNPPARRTRLPCGPLPELQPQARQRHRPGAGKTRTRASTSAWAPTARRATTGSTCSRKCASPPCSPRARAAMPPRCPPTRRWPWPPSMPPKRWASTA